MNDMKERDVRASEFNALDFVNVTLGLGLSSAGMADALGVDVRRVRAYASGERPIPKLVALAAWALAWRPRVADARRLLTRDG